MIESVEIRNFKSIRDQRIELEPLTVFVGANGSGKTSVLEALSLAALVVTRGDPEQIFSGERHCDWLYTRDATEPLSIGLDSDPQGPILEAHPPALHSHLARDMGAQKWKYNIRNGWHVDGYVEMNFCELIRLDSRKLARPAYTHNDPPRIMQDGNGLASVLAYMALNDPDTFHELNDHVGMLIPHFKRIRFRKAPVNRPETEVLLIGEESVERRTSRTYMGDAILFDFDNAESIPAHAVSEGTLMMLAFLTVLYGPSHPRLVLMDDIERGLHPMAQKSLLAVIRKLMERFPDLQILATAHSPYLLDDLRPEEIRLMTLGEDGSSICGRLDQHPEFEKWKGEMAPGELWSLFGEKWLLQGGNAR